MIAWDYAYDETEEKSQFKQGSRSRSISTPHSTIRLKLYNKVREKGEPFML